MHIYQLLNGEREVNISRRLRLDAEMTEIKVLQLTIHYIVYVW